ncbi:hypothetical protein ACYSNU_06680 [Enterococcus sp. LJL120]
MGIIIPMVMPKIVIGPASFTLASHVPLFIAMFISPAVAVAVALGTAFGFFVSLPLVVALRALSHLVFAIIGSLYLQKNPGILMANGRFTLFNWKFQSYNVILGIIHAAVEMVVVSVFFFGGNMPEVYYTQGFFYTVFVLLGVGGFVHSLVDYNIAYFVANLLSKQIDIPVFTKAKALAKNETPDLKKVPSV